MNQPIRIAVVGGGLAGLVAAIHAARAGTQVTLYEGVRSLGGRARTREEQGFLFNMGPHALYTAGPASRILDALGISLPGAAPPVSGSLARCEGKLHALPGGLVSLLTTGLLRLPEKLALGRTLAAFPRLDPAAYDRRSVSDVVGELLPTPRLRQVLLALVRLTSYANAPDRMSAGAAFSQVQAGLDGGVRYLDGGWQSMVDALSDVARSAGVIPRGGVRVRAVEHDGEVRAVRLDDDRSEPADRVVLAMGPGEASALVAAGSHPPLHTIAESAVPARAASLDLGLSSLPVQRKRFALGIDEPTYFSVHTPVAALAPEGGAVIHVARYLAPEEKPERAELAADFEAFLDQMQPGWRERVVSRRLLSDLRVAHAIPTLQTGGLGGRPTEEAAGIAGLYVAGDWVGPEGQLADASFASGRAAGLAAARPRL